MRLVIQLVKNAHVKTPNIDNSIATGAIIYVGICKDDTPDTIKKAVIKLLKARIVPDQSGKINLTLKDTLAQILVISNFTLCARHNQNRPSFSGAASAQEARGLYELFVQELQKSMDVKTGEFQGMMDITTDIYGPYTYVIDIH